jgi:hypothetical protein
MIVIKYVLTLHYFLKVYVILNIAVTLSLRIGHGILRSVGKGYVRLY